jgi:protein-tyrosine phosphatase
VRRLATINILFVCTGNTCRSPMAEGFALRWLAERFSCTIDELADRGYSVASAGALASEGAPAAANAVDILGERGVNLSSHQSQGLRRELILRADAIYGMTDEHVEAVVQIVPGAAGKTQRLDPLGSIPDPIGGDRATYAEAAKTIERAVVARLKELLP